MAMAWMRMSGAPWSGMTAFLVMWIVMTMAMMLPSLAPTLWGYHQALGSAGEPRASWLTLVAGAAYFVVWTVFGVAVFPLGPALAAAEQRLPSLVRAIPAAVGVVVLIAGMMQFTTWKARHLARCRETPLLDHAVPTHAGTAWRHGLRLGLHCGISCAGPMASLLAIGLMDLRAMAVVTAAITLERLAPAGQRVARFIGVAGFTAGALLVARAVGPG